MNEDIKFPAHLVNLESNKFLQINNCGAQTRNYGFTVERNSGWRDYHILLILKGKCRVYHNQKENILYPGGVVLYYPFEPQKYIFPKECVSLWLHFSGKAASEILETCNLSGGVYQLNSDKALTDLFWSLINRFNRSETKKYATATLIEMLCYLSDKIKSNDSVICPNGIYEVTSYINLNYEKTITLAELAKISGYSKSRFSALFKQYMGLTPVEYQRNIRLNSSCDLLCSTNLNISEVAAKCGYDDALYFSRIFKKSFGISPSEYKNNYYAQIFN